MLLFAIGELFQQSLGTAELLERKSTIPQVQKKLTLIKDIQTDEFWVNVSVLTMETVRRELRDLMQFLIGGMVFRKSLPSLMIL